MYYFEKYDAVYVGRTINKKRRDREHIFNTESDAVARFAMRHNIAVPSMIILEENLTLEKGQEREDYWVNYYKEQGYNILNSGRTGVGLGSLGSLAGIKWTKDKCFEEAKKYSYRKEFQRGSVGAYTRALKRGWLKEYTWFKRPQSWNQKWNQESCYDEALKYIARLAKGGMRDSITTLEKCLDYNQNLSLVNVQAVTSGGASEETLLQFMKLLLNGDGKGALNCFNDYLKYLDCSRTSNGLRLQQTIGFPYQLDMTSLA